MKSTYFLPGYSFQSVYYARYTWQSESIKPSVWLNTALQLVRKLHYFARVIQVSQIFIYPIKSLGGIAVSQAQLTATGFEHDRRWMLVDENNIFLTQRSFPSMALPQTNLSQQYLEVFHKQDAQLKITIPITLHGNVLEVQVWDDVCNAIDTGKEHHQWFSDILQKKCKLVYMPEDCKRLVDKRYASNNENTSFSDGYPLNMISEESLADLNSRLEEPLPMNRFRPNLVIKGCLPYEEDVMKEFSINGINLSGVKLCSRCVVTTINQQNTFKSKEPLKTLATYRKQDNKIFFGQNILFQSTGTIAKGNKLHITKRNEWPVFEQ